jgi:hypothetical protein
MWLSESSEVSNGILIRGNYKKKKNQKRARYLPENTSDAGKKNAKNKKI